MRRKRSLSMETLQPRIVLDGFERRLGATRKSLQEKTVDFILASTAIEIGAVLVSDDKVFQTLGTIYPSLRVENWKALPADSR